MIYVVAAIFVFILIALVYAIGGVLLALAWNFVVPLFWAAAPHLSWLHGIAIMWLVGIVQSIFRPNVTVNKKG